MVADIDTAELRNLIEKHGPPLSPMLIFTLLDEIDRLRASIGKKAMGNG